MAPLFESFGSKSFFWQKKLVSIIYGAPNSTQVDKLFFPNLYMVYNLYILVDLYLSSQREFVQGPLDPTPIVWSAPNSKGASVAFQEYYEHMIFIL